MSATTLLKKKKEYDLLGRYARAAMSSAVIMVCSCSSLMIYSEIFYAAIKLYNKNSS